MKKRRAVAFIITACLLICVIKPVAADGNRYWEYGMRYKNFAVKSYSNSYNATWVSILDNSRSAWNNSKAGTTISTQANSNHEILAAQYNDTWYGLFTVESSSQGYISNCNIKVNARTIKANASNFSNFARSTVVHEFGHAFFLDDNPPTSSASIMSYGRNRNTMVSPQTYDVNNVNERYKLIP